MSPDPLDALDPDEVAPAVANVEAIVSPSRRRAGSRRPVATPGGTT